MASVHSARAFFFSLPPSRWPRDGGFPTDEGACVRGACENSGPWAPTRTPPHPPPTRNPAPQEYKEYARTPDANAGIDLAPVDGNMLAWTAWIAGPPDTPYASAEFRLAIAVPDAYPLTPPAVTFATRVFHPNVHFRTGEVCVDILKNAWSPAWTLASVCHAVRALLAAPAPDSPLNCDAGNLLRAGDERGFASVARMYATEDARPRAAKKGS